MKSFRNICICGGGNLGTVIAGVASSKGYDVSILTGHPEKWNNLITVTDCRGAHFAGTLNKIGNNAADIVPSADVVILCLPGNAIAPWIEKIKPYLRPDTPVGSVFCSSGFFPIAISMLGGEQPLFGLQRVPFISRVEEYGKSASLLGYRREIRMASWALQNIQPLRLFLEDIFLTPVSLLTSPLSVTLTNSNPLLHPARLYNLFSPEKEIEGYEHNIPFYGEWEVESSRTLIALDNEFQHIIARLGIPKGEIIPLLEYYESTDAESLTRKISSIESWHNLPSPMTKHADSRYRADWSSRYFTEDIPQGLFVIKVLAHRVGVTTPAIDKILSWYGQASGLEFIDAQGHPVSNDMTRSIPVLTPEGLDTILRRAGHISIAKPSF